MVYGINVVAVYNFIAYHTSSLYNFFLVLCHVLKNIWNLSCSSCVSTAQNCLFGEIQFKLYNQIFFESISKYSMLEKIKIRRYCKPFNQFFLIALSLILTTTTEPSAFLNQSESLKHLVIVFLGRTSLHILFHPSKNHNFNRYLCC